MAEITTFPTEELRADLQESLDDIGVCERALALGVTTYGDNESVQHRLEVNRAIVGKIEAGFSRFR